MNDDTIAAIATAQGQGGIGIIRISGSNSIELVDKIFRSVSGKKLIDMPGYKASFGKIVENNENIDEVIVLIFRNPKSYTGEDVAEIYCHGGIFVTRQILRLVLDLGARPAEPGEFTKRAFLNGKMDLTEAESVMKIIGATSENSAKIAMSAHEGQISDNINSIKNNLVSMSAKLSVWADYPDDDTVNVSTKDFEEELKKIKKELETLISNYDKGKILTNGVRTAIIGAPNVGKSTLMNMLSGTNKSIVTSIPGTTRDVVEESVNLGEISLRIFDTAGIHETNDLVESIGVERAKSLINSAELIFLVLDGSQSLSENDMKLLHEIKNNNAIAVVNKSDLGTVLDCDYVKSFVKCVVHISAKNGEGLDALERAVLQVVGLENLNPSEGILITERQFVQVKKARDLVAEALEALSSGMTLDAVTVSINCAIDELLSLTGEKATEIVVNEVFSKFCVGK